MSTIGEWTNQIHQGDATETMAEMPADSVDCIVTSPPYWGLRSYGTDEEIGSDPDLDGYIGSVADVFHEAKRVLSDDGVLFLNIGDQYQSTAPNTQNAVSNISEKTGKSQGDHFRFDSGLPAKCMMMVPERLTMSMVDDGWVLRNKIVWEKNPMPEPSAKDRFKQSWEPIFMLTPGSYYDFNEEYSTVPDVWKIATSTTKTDHPAPFPEELCQKAISAGSESGDVVLDPFAGSGTACRVAKELGRDFIGIDLNPEYVEMARDRLRDVCVVNGVGQQGLSAFGGGESE